MTEKPISFKNHKYDIKIKQDEYHKSNGLDASFLTLLWSGKDCTEKILNALRRSAMNNIPTYAFSHDLITIDINTSAGFDNDQMTDRLAQLPVIGVDPDLYHLTEKYWYNVKYADIKREKHPAEKQIELYVNVHNNSANIMRVTTNDASVFIDSTQEKVYSDKYPMLLINLNPDERFKCHMKAVLGVGEKNVIWKGARNGYYDDGKDGKNDKKNDKNEFTFTIEANNHITEYNLLIRACKFLIKKITDLKTDLEAQIKEKRIKQSKIYDYRLEREDHTIGELLNYEFQGHDSILGSGLSKPDHLIKAINIRVESMEKSPLNAMIECMDELIKKISHIGHLISELQPNNDSNKYIQNNSNKHVQSTSLSSNIQSKNNNNLLNSTSESSSESESETKSESTQSSSSSDSESTYIPIKKTSKKPLPKKSKK